MCVRLRVLNRAISRGKTVSLLDGHRREGLHAVSQAVANVGSARITLVFITQEVFCWGTNYPLQNNPTQ